MEERYLNFYVHLFNDLTMLRIIFIAWQQLSYQKTRLIVTILGVTFSVSLMFIQLGFGSGIFETSITLHKALDADLVLLHSDSQYFFNLKAFPRRFLYTILAVDGIQSANPFYFGVGNFKNPNNFTSRPISIGAFKPDQPVFKLPDINEQISLLTQKNVYLFDRLSRSEYGINANIFNRQGYIETELANQQIKIRGLFSLGGGILSADGLLLTSDTNYALTLKQPLEKINLGAIKLDHHVNHQKILQQISEKLPSNLKVLTLNQFMDLEKTYWATSTPIGFIFNLGTFIGCIFGGIIVYQILYTQISDNLYIYATFKAIGYSNFYLVSLVFQEALLMAVLGYIPGFVLSTYVYDFVQTATRLPMNINLTRALLVLFLTIIMCFISSLLAIGKLRHADPADIFT